MEMKISKRESGLLEVMYGNAAYSPTEWCYSFNDLVRAVNNPEVVNQANVRRITHSMQRKGLVSFQRGLFNDDGEAAGSGYGLTEMGAYFVDHGKFHDGSRVQPLVFMKSGYFVASDQRLTHDKDEALTSFDPLGIPDSTPIWRDIAPKYSPLLKPSQNKEMTIQSLQGLNKSLCDKVAELAIENKSLKETIKSLEGSRLPPQS